MSTRRKKVDALQYDSTFDDSCDELFIGTVSVDSIQQNEDWKESVTINQQSVMFNLSLWFYFTDLFNGMH
jgi:hypothetical protein